MSQQSVQAVVTIDMAEVRKNWAWFLMVGALLVVLGVVAISYSVVATLASVILFGWLLIVAGAFQAAHGFWRRQWGGFFIDLFAGLLSLVVGIMVVGNPAESAVSLTLLVAMFLLVGGIFRVFIAVSTPFQHRGWVLLNGIITVVLGVLIWRQWPLDGLWVIGLFVGIDMLMNGWTMIMLGLAARSAR